MTFWEQLLESHESSAGFKKPQQYQIKPLFYLQLCETTDITKHDGTRSNNLVSSDFDILILLWLVLWHTALSMVCDAPFNKKGCIVGGDLI